MNRGRRGYAIFKSKEDRLCFIDLLLEAIELFSLRISAYCLMSNHYHLLVQTPDANLSRCMRHLNGIYTQRFNNANGMDGPLFRGRYKAILVGQDSYLLQLVRYIHKNPIRSRMVQTAGQYEWSSHRGYLSSAKKWQWLHKDFILSMISKEPTQRIKWYRAFMAQDESESFLQTMSLKKLPSVIGESQFVDTIKERYFEEKRHVEVPESKRLAPDTDHIIGAVCDYYNLKMTQLLHSKRGEFNEARSMAFYLIRYLRGDSLINIGKVFRVNSYSTVSSVIERFKERMESDRQLYRRVERIKDALMRQGQT